MMDIYYVLSTLLGSIIPTEQIETQDSEKQSILVKVTETEEESQGWKPGYQIKISLLSSTSISHSVCTSY